MNPLRWRISFEAVQRETMGSWRGFRRYLLIMGPTLILGLALFRHPNLGALVVVVGVVGYYGAVCLAVARRSGGGHPR